VILDSRTGSLLAVAGLLVRPADTPLCPGCPAAISADLVRIFMSFGLKSATATEVASGSPLLVDVEFGRGRRLYALSQGVGSGGPAGPPALPNTGVLVKVNRHGTFTVVTDHLNQPTSLEFIKNTAYVVTLGGEIWKIHGAWGPPHGAAR
jgi:hypothetical protein